MVASVVIHARFCKRTLPLKLGLLLLTIAVAVSACSNSDGGTYSQPIDAAERSSPAATPTPATGEPSAEPTATRAAETATVDPEFEFLDEPRTRYISTEGTGVVMRGTCLGEPRGGQPWPDGTQVTVTAVGVGRCDGWSVADSGGKLTWLEDRFLVEAVPSVRSAPSPPSRAPTVRPTTTPTPTPSPTASNVQASVAHLDKDAEPKVIRHIDGDCEAPRSTPLRPGSEGGAEWIHHDRWGACHSCLDGLR